MPGPSSPTASSTDLLKSRRAELRTKLAACATPADSARVTIEALNIIRAQVLEQLPVRDGRLFSELIDATRGGLQSLGVEASISSTPLRVLPPRRAHPFQLALTGAQLAACAALLFAPLQLPMIAWFIILALGILIAIEFSMMAWSMLPQGWRAAFGSALAIESTTPSPEQPAITINPDAICDRLATCLAAIDAILAERSAAPAKAPLSASLSNYGDLIEYLQAIAGLAARNKAEALVDVGDQAAHILARYNLRLRHFSVSLSAAEREHFDLETDLSGQLREPRPELPAILSDEGVIRRGRATLPAGARR